MGKRLLSLLGLAVGKSFAQPILKFSCQNTIRGTLPFVLSYSAHKSVKVLPYLILTLTGAVQWPGLTSPWITWRNKSRLVKQFVQSHKAGKRLIIWLKPDYLQGSPWYCITISKYQPRWKKRRVRENHERHKLSPLRKTMRSYHSSDNKATTCPSFPKAGHPEGKGQQEKHPNIGRGT